MPNPGVCGFKVQFPKDKYNHSRRSVFINPKVCLAAMFLFEREKPPADCFVRVMVCVKDPKDLVRIGVCKRCLRHPAKGAGVCESV